MSDPHAPHAAPTRTAGTTHLVETSKGTVELVHLAGPGGTVLLLPAAEVDAHGPSGESIYHDLGLDVWLVSRPGHGQTHVGELGTEEFTPVLREALESQGIGPLAAVVGVGLGSMAAIDLAASDPTLAGRLVLHNAKPSQLPSPISPVRRASRQLLEATPAAQWTEAASHRLATSVSGLGMVAARLTAGRTGASVVNNLTPAERKEASAAIAARVASPGLTWEGREARVTDGSRRTARMREVRVPTLVSASRADAVPNAHARSIAETIPGARLVVNEAAWNLFWIGRGRRQVQADVRRFLDSTTAGPVAPAPTTQQETTA